MQMREHRCEHHQHQLVLASLCPVSQPKALRNQGLPALSFEVIIQNHVQLQTYLISLEAPKLVHISSA